MQAQRGPTRQGAHVVLQFETGVAGEFLGRVATKPHETSGGQGTVAAARERAPAAREGARVGAGVVFFTALVAILIACRRLRRRARFEEASAFLKREAADDERPRPSP